VIAGDCPAKTVSDRLPPRAYIASTITRRHLAARLPAFDGPLVARCSTAVFVATIADAHAAT
jgi:hypothetical protein